MNKAKEKTERMKAKAMMLFVVLAAGFASCSQDDVLQGTVNNNPEGLQPVALSVALPGGGMQTRTASATEDEAPTHCYLQVLVKQGDYTYAAATGDLEGVREMTKQADNTFTLSDIYLNPDEDYRFLFWADNADREEGNVPSSLTSVSYQTGTIAFAAAENWEDKESATVNATLKHVVTKVTLKTTTDIKALQSVSVTLAKTHTIYNVDAEGIAESAEGKEKTFNYIVEETITADPTDGTPVFSVYALVDGEPQTVTIANDIAYKDVNNVPLAADKHITLLGDVAHIGLPTVTLTATINAQWSTTIISGDGYTYDSSTNTYTVSNAAGLQAWAEAAWKDLNTNCTLAANITLTGTNNWTPVGDDDSRYTGIFDGAGHTISGLNIYQEKTGTNNYAYTGVIGSLDNNGTVKNLTVTDAVMTATAEASLYAGIVGYCAQGTISGCGFSGSVSATSTVRSSVGGIVGNNNGSITACWSVVKKLSTTGGNLTNYAGAIVGMSNIYDATITSCFYDYGGEGAGDGYGDVTKVPDNATWQQAAEKMNEALTEYKWEVTGETVPLKLVKR